MLPVQPLDFEVSRELAPGLHWLSPAFAFRARLGFSIPVPHFDQRGVTPAFGSDAPHSSVGGTTRPIEPSRGNGHCRFAFFGLRGAKRLVASIERRRVAAAGHHRIVHALGVAPDQPSRGQSGEHRVEFCDEVLLPGESSQLNKPQVVTHGVQVDFA